MKRALRVDEAGQEGVMKVFRFSHGSLSRRSQAAGKGVVRRGPQAAK
jgi:hypothetical protein